MAVLLALSTVAFAVEPGLRKRAGDSDPSERAEAARLLAKDGSKEAVALLRKLVEDKEPGVRDVAVWACSEVADPKAAEELVPLTRDKDALVRMNGVVALARTGAPLAVDLIESLAGGDKVVRVREEAVACIPTLRSAKDVRRLAAAALKDAAPEVRAAALIAFVASKGDDALAAATAAYDDPDEGVRCVARWALAKLDPEAALARIGRTRDDDGWRTRVQVVEDALTLREAPAMDALVALVGDGNERVASSALSALQALSGTDLGADRALWEEWWKANREGWTPPKGRAALRSRKRTPGRTSAAFHGIGVATARAVFVLDHSASIAMERDGRRKWDRVTEHLKETLAALPDTVRVNVVLFDDKVTTAFDEPRTLDPKCRQDLDRFFTRHRFPMGGTNLLGGLETALAMEVDSMFVLTDGSPTVGDMVLAARVKERVTRANRRRKVAIHTVAFGADAAATGLLRELAGSNDGEFAER